MLLCFGYTHPAMHYVHAVNNDMSFIGNIPSGNDFFMYKAGIDTKWREQSLFLASLCTAAVKLTQHAD